MPKTYKLNVSTADEDQMTITISEEVTETREIRTSVAQLKQEYQNKIDRIKKLGKEADEIIDELEGINSNMSEIAVDNIPARVLDGQATNVKIPNK